MSSHIFTPDYSHITGLLQQLNDEELKELLESEEKLKAIINDSKQIHDIEAEREMLIASNKSISEYNLSKKPILELHRKQVEETHKIALELKNSFLEKKRKIESKEKEVSKDTLLALLQAATSEVEEEAEAAVENFLKNELPVEDFLEKYLELRKLAHLRRIKAEKLTNILQVDCGQSLTPPFRPQKLRPPPVPPVTRPELPYPNTPKEASQNNVSYGPVRTAPRPPASNFSYPTSMYPQPPQQYRYVTPAPYPGYFAPPAQQYPPYR